jgi:hypothetical protein
MFAVAHVEDQQVSSARVEGLKVCADQGGPQVVKQNRILTDRVDADLLQRTILKINAVPAAENFRPLIALKVVVDGKTAVVAGGKIGVCNQFRRGDAGGNENEIGRLRRFSVGFYPAGFHLTDLVSFVDVRPPFLQRSFHPTCQLLRFALEEPALAVNPDFRGAAGGSAGQPHEVSGNFCGRRTSTYHSNIDGSLCCERRKSFAGLDEALDRLDEEHVLQAGRCDPARNFRSHVQRHHVVGQ